MTPSNLLREDHILLDADCSSKKRVFEQIALLLENSDTEKRVVRKSVFESLIARERLGSTVIGEGIAIPHGRMAGLSEPIAAFVRLSQPILFESEDKSPVKNLFVIMSPESPSASHLRVCSLFTQMAGDPELMGALDRTPDAGAAHRLIRQWETRHVPQLNGHDQLGSATG